MFYLIGLGLGSAKDITVAGLDAVKSSKDVYLEAYTSKLMDSEIPELEAMYGKSITLADREMVENQSDLILANAAEQNVAFLVAGDPFGATTHTDLLLRCREKGIEYRTFHNASILNAIGATGLSLYNFGQTVSVPFFVGNWKPRSWVDRVFDNLDLGLHTLLLLDIKVKEQSEENLARGRKIYEKPRFMSVPQAISQLMICMEPSSPIDEDDDLEDTSPDTKPVSSSKTRQRTLDPDTTLAISVSRVGSLTQTFRAGSLTELSKLEPESFGDPLHSLIIIGHRLNPIERDYISDFAIDQAQWSTLTTEKYHCAG